MQGHTAIRTALKGTMNWQNFRPAQAYVETFVTVDVANCGSPRFYLIYKTPAQTSLSDIRQQNNRFMDSLRHKRVLAQIHQVWHLLRRVNSDIALFNDDA